MSDSEASEATIARNPPDVDDTKLPAGKLLETSDLPGPAEKIPWHKVELPVDALLLTVKDCEFLSCVSFLNPGFYKGYHNDLGYVYFGKINCAEGNTPLKIAITMCEMVPNGATLAVKNTVTILKPKAVFCVGYCGGLSNKVKLGDVVISSKLRTYSAIRVTASGIENRGVGVPLNRHLAKLILNADAGWKQPLKDEVKVKAIKNGVFLSGPEVVDSKDRRAELIERFPDATAIEMEGEGKINVVEQRVKSMSKAWQGLSLVNKLVFFPLENTWEDEKLALVFPYSIIHLHLGHQLQKFRGQSGCFLGGGGGRVEFNWDYKK